MEPRSVGIALVDGTCDLERREELTLAEGLHDCRRRGVQLLNYIYPGICYKTAGKQKTSVRVAE
jgi:hypothetical protein